jgi:hypothetical protein
VQLLAGADADELDRDVALRLPAREPDHVVREVHDLHRLAHVEHEDVAALADRPGLDDELYGLRDGHEVALHVRVRDRDRPAPGDLAPEERDDAARGAEHVAEADGDEARAVRPARRGGLDQPLAEGLRLAEHVLRSHRLVGGDEHEALHAALGGDLGDDPRANDVVSHRLERVRLHERDVLVGGRVEDDIGAVAVEEPPDLHPVLDVGEHGYGRREAPLVLQLALDRHERVLGVLHEDDLRGAERGDLAAELGADRAARAGHEDRRAGDVGRDRGHVEVDGVAAEHVLDLHLAQLLEEVEVARDQLVDARQRLHRHAGVAAGGHDPLADVAGGGRDGDDDLVRLLVGHQAR